MNRLAGFLFGIILALLPASAFSQPSNPESPLAPGAHEFSVDGVKLWYRVAGQPDGMPLVFLHGGPGQGSQTFQAAGGPALESTRRLVYFDQRGAGRSERPEEAGFYSLDLMVEDIEALRRHLGVHRIALLGHSFGTILALEYAARFPDRAGAVVLAAAVPDWPRQQELLCEQLARTDPEAHERAIAAVQTGDAFSCRAFGAYQGPAMKDFVYGNMFPDPATGELVDRLDAADGLGNTGQPGRALFGQGLLNYRFQHPERITAPVLIIAGGKDFQAVIEPQRELAAALSNATLLEYPENGHFMFIEDPVRFGRDVTAFLTGL